MAATEIVMYRGDHHIANVQVLDDSGVPVDVTGARIRFTIDARPDQVYKDSDNGTTEVEFVNPTSGQFQIKLVPDDTLTMEIGTYNFDIEMTLATKISTLDVGFFRVQADVTQPAP